MQHQIDELNKKLHKLQEELTRVSSQAKDLQQQLTDKENNFRGTQILVFPSSVLNIKCPILIACCGIVLKILIFNAAFKI